MKKQKKSFYIIVGILVVLIVAVLLIKAANKRSEAQESQEAEAARIYVTDFDAEDITSFSYQYDGQTLSFTKSGDDWTYDGDSSIDIDEDMISTMLSAVSNLEANQKLTEYDDLSEYGLTDPTNTITLNMSTGSVTLLFGDQNQIVGGYYLMVDGQTPVYLISTNLNSTFGSSVEELTVEEEETETTEAVETTEALETTDGTEAVEETETTEADETVTVE